MNRKKFRMEGFDFFAIVNDFFALNASRSNSLFRRIAAEMPQLWPREPRRLRSYGGH